MQTTEKVHLIDRELVCRGTSAAAWAERYGMTKAQLAQWIEQPEHPITIDLAEFLGISIETLVAC